MSTKKEIQFGLTSQTARDLKNHFEKLLWRGISYKHGILEHTSAHFV